MRRSLRWLTLAGSVGLFLLAAGLVVFLAASSEVDAPLRAWVVASGGVAFDGATLVSLVGSTTVTIVLVLLGVAFSWWRGRARDAYVAAAGILVAQLLDLALKVWVDRPRPPYALIAEDPWSFPSGHATRAASLVVALAWFTWRATRSSRATWTAGLVSSAWALGIGWARLALGVHYASDVLSGWGVGLAGCVLGILLAGRIVDRVLPRLPEVFSGVPGWQ